MLRTNEAGPSKPQSQPRRHKRKGLYTIVADKTKTFELIDALLSIDTERNLSEERMAEVVQLSLQDWMLLEKIFLAARLRFPITNEKVG